MSRLLDLVRAVGRHATLVATVMLTVVALALGWLVVKDQFRGARTYGRIIVDTPEIYTRERLVNDRFLQDAWLARQLETDGTGGSQVFSESRQARIRAALRPAASAPPGPGPEEPRAEPKDVPKLSSRDKLVDAVDFRDQVRNFLIENQLDDRHDLNGNSLYRLKFDATIVPGVNTQALAEVHVRLLGPSFGTGAATKENQPIRRLRDLGTEESIRGWHGVYTRWLESLQSRLNQTHRELKQAFVNNEFSHNDYARFIAFLRSNLGVSVDGIAACPVAVTDVRDQLEREAQIRPEDHAARKRCVAALVEKKLRIKGPGNPVVVEQEATPGYISRSSVATPVDRVFPRPDGPSAPRQAGSDKTPRTITSAEISRELEAWLNAFFASKTIQLVLGISVPEASFVGNTYFNVPTLEALIRLTFLNPRLETDDGSVFLVLPKRFNVAAFDAGKIRPADFDDLSNERAPGIFGNKSLQDFQEVILSGAAKGKLLVSRMDLGQIERDSYLVEWDDFSPLTVRDGAFAAIAEVGLLNFVRKARMHSAAFTYAVSPKENAVTVASTLDVASSLATEGKAGTLADGVSLDLRRGAMARALNRRGTVVGYGSATRSGTDAEFGWIIGPTRLAFDGRSIERLHEPTQYALSALVSIPSWWNEVNFEVTTTWVDPAGDRIGSVSREMRYRVQLPTDFEPLEATLLEVLQLGPELMESRLDPILLTACRPGAIMIPGRRLWRSTVVTLGYQTADEISVLPNMKGIIAKFLVVENQASVREESVGARGAPKGEAFEIQRPVRVWTSQGTIALPNPARIGIPEGCRDKGQR